MRDGHFCRPGAVATPDATSCPPTLPSATCPLLSSTALTALTQLQALGLSHNMLDSWPTAVERLAPSLRVVSESASAAACPPARCGSSRWCYETAAVETKRSSPVPCSYSVSTLWCYRPRPWLFPLPFSRPTGCPPFVQLYLESNPGLARLPPSAAAVLSRLRVLSIDCRSAHVAGWLAGCCWVSVCLHGCMGQRLLG